MLRDAFDLFDVDGSGDIDRSEFKNFMKVRVLRLSGSASGGLAMLGVIGCTTGCFDCAQTCIFLRHSRHLLVVYVYAIISVVSPYFITSWLC